MPHVLGYPSGMARPVRFTPLPDARYQELYEKWVHGDEHFARARGRHDYLKDADYDDLWDAHRGIKRENRFQTGRKILPQDFVLTALPAGATAYLPQNCKARSVRGSILMKLTYDAVPMDPALVSQGQSLRLGGVEVGRVIPTGQGLWYVLQLPVLYMGSFAGNGILADAAPDAAQAAEYLAQCAAPQLNSRRTYLM
jgi:hypothetical protein